MKDLQSDSFLETIRLVHDVVGSRASVHACLLLLDLLDDEERCVEESVDAVLETGSFGPTELSRQTTGDTSEPQSDRSAGA